MRETEFSCELEWSSIEFMKAKKQKVSINKNQLGRSSHNDYGMKKVRW